MEPMTAGAIAVLDIAAVVAHAAVEQGLNGPSRHDDPVVGVLRASASDIGVLHRVGVADEWGVPKIIAAASSAARPNQVA
jgi:hypothetical protein